MSTLRTPSPFFICRILDGRGQGIRGVHVMAHWPGRPVLTARSDREGFAAIWCPSHDPSQPQLIHVDDLPQFTLSFDLTHIRAPYQIPWPIVNADVRLEPMTECCVTLHLTDTYTYSLEYNMFPLHRASPLNGTESDDTTPRERETTVENANREP